MFVHRHGSEYRCIDDSKISTIQVVEFLVNEGKADVDKAAKSTAGSGRLGPSASVTQPT